MSRASLEAALTALEAEPDAEDIDAILAIYDADITAAEEATAAELPTYAEITSDEAAAGIAAPADGKFSLTKISGKSADYGPRFVLRFTVGADVHTWVGSAHPATALPGEMKYAGVTNDEPTPF